MTEFERIRIKKIKEVEALPRPPIKYFIAMIWCSIKGILIIALGVIITRYFESIAWIQRRTCRHKMTLVVTRFNKLIVYCDKCGKYYDLK